MKHLLFLLLLSAPAHVFAQVHPALEGLEGHWYQTGRSAAIFSRWTATAGDQIFANFTYTILCGDTVLLSRAEIRYDDQSARMTVLTDSTGYAEVQIFRLVRASLDELFWENENPEGSPRHLSWIFFGDDYVTFRADGVNTDFRRARQLNIRLLSRVQVGGGVSKRHTNARRPAYLPLQQATPTYQTGPAFETAVSVGLHNPEGPLGATLELGYTQRTIGFNSSMTLDQIQYNNTGTLRYTSTYLAFIPEVVFGRRRAFTTSMGMYIDLATRADFSGESDATGPGTPDPKLLQPNSTKSAERGLILGLAFELPFKALKNLSPGVYSRMAVDLGNGAGLTTYSAGIRLRMGKG